MRARFRYQPECWRWVCAALIIVQSLTLSTCTLFRHSAKLLVSIDVGTPVELGTVTVGPDGGTLIVDKPSDPLDGLSIKISQGAADNPIEFSVSESPILKVTAKQGVTAISPLITIENSAGYADEAIEVKVPVKVPEGHFAMGFIYDPAAQSFEGLPTFAEDDSSLTIFTRHFSSVCLLDISKDALDSLQMMTDPEFLPGRDTWNLKNMGSYLAPGGFCEGMTLSALYYFLYEKPIAEENLWQADNDNGLFAGMKTPDFWQDDKWAIQLCSAASYTKETAEAGKAIQLYEATLEDILGRKPDKRDERDFYLTALSLLITGEPQLMAVWNLWTGEGHSLICYGINNRQLLIADPNYPSRRDLSIRYDSFSGKFAPYSSAESLLDVLAGKVVSYDIIAYCGQTCFYDLRALEQLWTDFQSGALDNRFPDYSIWVNELDEGGNTVDRYGLDTTNGHTTSAKPLKFELDAPFEAQLKVYRYEDLKTALSPDRVDLHPGDNYLGLYVEGKKDGEWWWAGFDWVKIVLNESAEKETAPTRDISSWSYCDITVHFDAVYRDPLTGEEHFSPYQTIDISNYGHEDAGKWSGNTFTASWQRRDESDTYEAPKHFYTEEVMLSVTVDPKTQNITKFSAQVTQKGDCGYTITHKVSGGECSLTGESPLSLRFQHYAEDGGWTPEITWIETGPPECGLPLYGLAKATYLNTLIWLQPNNAP